MKTRTIAFSVRALALGTLLAASPLSFAAEPSGGKSTAKDIAKKADETGKAIKNYTVAQRDEAIKNAKAALDDADRRIDRMERKLDTEWERMDQATRKRARATLDALRREEEAVERQSREALLEQQVTEAELRALRAQINPHFLFNCLNTIADLVVRNPARAETMTLRLAEVFRHVLDHSSRPLTSIRDEIEFLRTYLYIEEARFGDRLQVKIEVEPGLEREQIPSEPYFLDVDAKEFWQLISHDHQAQADLEAR